MQILSLGQAIKSGLVRSNRWRVVVNFPGYAGNGADGAQAALLARTTNTPSANIGVIDLTWGGRNLPIPGDRTYEEFTVTFIGVNDMKVYNAFQKWSENINGSDSNRGLTNLDTIMNDITLELLDVNDQVTKTYLLHDSWPAAVGQMSLDSGEMDGYSQFDVIFRYISYTQPNITI
jgi:T4-like virus tail tube protein gp19